MTVSLRLARAFQKAKQKGHPAFLSFIMAGDPDFSTSLALLKGLPKWCDIVELGMPFSDPMADGPAIQASGERALKAKHTMEKTFKMVSVFRENNQETPLVLMGYYNPIYIYGRERFIAECLKTGVDALIVVDLPFEEDAEFFELSQALGLPAIRLLTPATGPKRMEVILEKAEGFVYYVSVLGITGTKTPDLLEVKRKISEIKMRSSLPVVAGFGVKTKEQMEALGAFCDGVVVGSAFVREIANSLDQGQATEETLPSVFALAERLSMN